MKEDRIQAIFVLLYKEYILVLEFQMILKALVACWQITVGGISPSQKLFLNVRDLRKQMFMES